ncbi:1,2-phenylacetyl-CoA epoxidase subunit PaaD [Nonomuraea endophytica]|uniref:Ring-1,2-phenylacetyl-CoA epoxidase subunit PaaD n=1 Tax=Nonomuraea endophytica TaxID=714136 RepID=A0A7W8AE36_9ACTN|nr:1,2-phenylacetyl-CoA epoxidase subunit PaaD [Nonomuraea endophytica]MBB5083103.1 ring-1,2-phenylacetyl-CoA epoxidase subunit PaaD [Nonomuraea endophytica]
MVTLAQARAVVSAVPDPELPVLTLGDLGIVREVRQGADGGFEVVVTPTYSGCPAMDAIREDIGRALPGAVVTTVLSPAWSTDWITDEGREKLREHGISPPGHLRDRGPVALELSARCPRCGSPETRLVSRYGSTACKALYTCRVCLEPFDHFKEI